MRLRTVIAFSVLALAAVAAAQSIGPRMAPITWSGATDGGFADGGIVDGGFKDAGIGAAEDGGNIFLDGGCPDGGPGSCTNLDGGFDIYDGGPQDGGWIDAGFADGGYVGAAFNHVSWLPVASAIYEGVATSDQVVFGTLTPGGCFVYFYVAPLTQSVAGGTLCLQEGGLPPLGAFVNVPSTCLPDAGCPLPCQTLDGGVGPYTWDIGGLHAPALRFSYTPGAASDGGWLVGAIRVTE